MTALAQSQHTLRRGTLALALLTAALTPVAARAQHFPVDEDLLVMLRYLVEDRETPGIVIGLLEADGSTRIVSYGSAGANAQPLGAKSVFEMGSIRATYQGTRKQDPESGI